MQKDFIAQTISPAPKTCRGYLSSIDVNQHHILYFNDNTVVLLPQDPTKPVLTLTHLSQVTAVKFSFDGRFVASIEAKGVLIISEICPDRLITVQQYDNFFANAKSLDWSPDGKRICAVGQGKTSYGRVALVQAGTNAGELTGVTGTLNSCSFRPARPFKLVLGGDEMALKFYDGPPFSFTKSDRSHKGFINQVKYSPKGTYILTGGADRKITLHEGLKYDLIAEKENAHNGGIFGLDWIDDQHFVTCSSDKLIKVWNIKMEEKFVIQAASKQDLTNPKKIQYFLVGIKVYKDLIYAINLEGDILIYKNPITTNHSDLIRTISGARNKIVSIIPFNQNQFILLDSGGRILVYSQLKHKTIAIDTVIQIKLIVGGFLQEAQSGKQIFVILGNGNIAIYRTDISASQFKFHKLLDKVVFKAISSHKNESIVCAQSNSVQIYNTKTEETQRKIDIKEDITYVEANQSHIFIGTIKGTIRVFDVTLKQLFSIQLATFKINLIKIIPEEHSASLVLFGDSCGNMKLISLKGDNFQIIKDTMGGHNSMITDASYDQKWLYTFAMDGKVNLWNRKTWMRQKQMNDIVKGGILKGESFNNQIIISGGNLITKIIPKMY